VFLLVDLAFSAHFRPVTLRLKELLCTILKNYLIINISRSSITCNNSCMNAFTDWKDFFVPSANSQYLIGGEGGFVSWLKRRIVAEMSFENKYFPNPCSLLVNFEGIAYESHLYAFRVLCRNKAVIVALSSPPQKRKWLVSSARLKDSRFGLQCTQKRRPDVAFCLKTLVSHVPSPKSLIQHKSRLSGLAWLNQRIDHRHQ